MFYFFALIFLAVLIIAWIIFIYNGLVRGRNLVREAWSGIDVQLKRRYDLIPNLVETVKGYSKHEEGIFTEVTRLRSAAINASSPEAKGHAEAALTAGLRSVFAVAEGYPELKANENFRDLQQSLQKVEDELQLARRYYNGTTREYNTSIESFPNVIIAGAMGFKQAGFFELDDVTERNTPKVAF
jgi:LemA protein